MAIKSAVGSVIFILIFSFATETRTEKCEDQQWCNDVSVEFCNVSLDMKKLCPTRCNSCPPLECDSCDQDCQMNAVGKYVCTCLNGFRLQSDDRSCVDIDECSEFTNLCPPGKDCKNEVGGFSCMDCRPFFKAGFRPSDSYPGRCCKLQSGTCGIKPSIWRNMISGSPRVYLPWQVLIILRKSDLCGGTLLNKLWVVSAAHCFAKISGPLAEEIDVYLGIFDLANLNSNSMRVAKRKVKQIIRHEKYVFPRNDIALLRMNKPIVYNRFISPICLPNGETPPVGTKCFVSGYTVEGLEHLRRKLQETEALITNGMICKKAYEGKHDFETDRMICADFPGELNNTCKGDSGGPLVCQRCDTCEWYLAGITSIFSGCSGSTQYGVYTKVEFFEEWIATKIKTISLKKEACFPRQWENWGDWSQCTKSCDSGSQSRSRVCQNGNVGEPNCVGEETQTIQCNEQPCKEDALPNVYIPN